ncbi:hypothetical protein H5V45_03930 [Nocardioides sp. KIGAM211]|uniref:Uncharacterized protein n=1 Tax=Nocardioides luti TaxID=2761101 RepID=A0A7X0RDV9_9ACTN|nr:hypothetical protein [Nocardioides luti]MBB6626466.1 hypothetical protein [Nocardioides luti]
MLGPLPRLYRSLVIAAILLVGVAGGAWIAYVSALPLAATVGALCGAVLALGIAFVMVHDFSHPRRPARAVRRP